MSDGREDKLEFALKEIAEMKIPYCDADDVAHIMRDIARDAQTILRRIKMVKHVPQADEKSAKMGWFFDPGFIHNVQRVAADVENPSMEAIDSILFALREMGYIKVAGTCEHGFTVEDCVSGMCELKKENEELVKFIRNGVRLGYISVPDMIDSAFSTIDRLCGDEDA